MKQKTEMEFAGAFAKASGKEFSLRLCAFVAKK
jgi:hypothetical protein